MSNKITSSAMPSVIEAKLGQVRRRQAAIAIARAVAIAASVLIGVMIAAMLVDWWLTLFDTRVRTSLTIASILVSVLAFLVTGMRPFITALGWTRAAIEVDREVPQLEERWTTVAAFAMPLSDPGLSPIGKAMLRQVTSEAVAMERLVQPSHVASPIALRPAALVFGGCLGAFVLFMGAGWPQSSVLFQRFWVPTANITATQLKSLTGNIIVPRGERIELIAKLTGLARNSAVLEIINSAGVRDAFNLKLDSEQNKEFVHSMTFNESARYHIRAGDGQTQWHTITVIDYPALGEIQFTVIAPEYVSRPDFERTLIPSRVKVLQGSQLTLRMKPLAELETLEIQLVYDASTNDDIATDQARREVIRLVADANGWYRFETQLMENLSLSPALKSIDGLSNDEKQTCRIQVLLDQAPVARVISPTDEMAVKADDVIEIKFEAHDDHGIASAELVVYQENPNDKSSSPKILSVQPIDLGDQQLQQHMLGSTKLDLSGFKLESGKNISYSIRVTDNRSVKLATVEQEQRRTPSQNAEAPSVPKTNDLAMQAETKEVKEAFSNESPRDSSPPSPQFSGEKGTGGEGQNRLETQPPQPQPLPLEDRAEESSVAASNEESGSKSLSENLSSKAEATKGEASNSKSSKVDPTNLSSKSQSTPGAKGEPLETSAVNKRVSISRENDEKERKDRDEKNRGVPNGAENKLASTNPSKPTQPRSTDTVTLPAQQSEDGQDSETKRLRLKITDKLVSISRDKTPRRRGDSINYRDRIVKVDEQLQESETALKSLAERTVADADRPEQFRSLDTQLGDVESSIADLRKDTKENHYSFVGLQMVDMGRTHVTPARDKAFAAIRQPLDESVASSQDCLQHIVRARGILTSFLTRFDAVERDEKLAKGLGETVKMYEVYVERSQRLMQEARQNGNPLKRKMAILEIDQEYLDRYAEVQTLRREMLNEFGRLLGDDPRLLSRYMDILKRRRSSMREQLGDLQARQDEMTKEVSGWLRVDESQRSDLWKLIAEMRLQTTDDLNKQAAELAERTEKQLPLGIEATQGTAAIVFKHVRRIAIQSNTIALESKRLLDSNEFTKMMVNARRLLDQFSELDATLEQLSFENENEQEITTYVTGRVLESRTVADLAHAWAQIASDISQQSFHGLTEIDQNKLAISTELLRVEMLAIESELEGQFQRQTEESVPSEIVDRIKQLHQIMEEITYNQAAATFAMTENRMEVVEVQQTKAADGFEQAVKLLDQIRREVASALDAYEVSNPNIADLRDPTLDEFLARLEREPNIQAQLGLAERPRNLRVIAETMTLQSSGGDFVGASARAAKQRSLDAMKKPSDQEKKEQDRETTPEEKEELAQAKSMQETLEKALTTLQQQAEDQERSPEERQRFAEAAENMRQMLEQLKNGEVPDDTWEKLAQSEQTKAMLAALARGEKIPDEQWNKLLSTLDEGLWQVRGRTPPEGYRKSIQQYQERIRQVMDAAGA